MSTTTLPYPNFNWKCSDQLCAWGIFQAKAEKPKQVEKPIQYTNLHVEVEEVLTRKRSKLHAKPKSKCMRYAQLWSQLVDSATNLDTMSKKYIAKHTQKNKKAKGKGTHQSHSQKVKPEKTKSKQSSLIPYSIITCHKLSIYSEDFIIDV